MVVASVVISVVLVSTVETVVSSVFPELSKIIELSDIFACKLDTLVRENLTEEEDIYSEITIKILINMVFHMQKGIT